MIGKKGFYKIYQKSPEIGNNDILGVIEADNIERISADNSEVSRLSWRAFVKDSELKKINFNESPDYILEIDGEKHNCQFYSQQKYNRGYIISGY
jgi:hypothetical protein